MKKITLLFLFCVYLGYSQNTVTVQVGTSSGYSGYVNVFDNPDDTTPDCGGGYCFGNSWTITDLAATIGANNVTLSPNTNTYTDAVAGDNAARNYWTNSTDGGVTAGPDGNKKMEANLFIESSTLFNGNDLTFNGQVTSYTLDSRYQAKFFIKALDPNNGYADVFNGSKVIDLPTSGNFTVSATGAELTTGLIVQYGFAIIGLNANPADDWGNVVVAPLSLSSEDFNNTTFATYPNPTDRNWNIASNNTTIDTIQVFNVLGKQVLSLKPNALNVEIDASALPSGLYFAKIGTALGTKSLKLVKK